MEAIPAKQILMRSKSSEWFGCDHTMNLYRGCPHGCIYCDSRSECYRVEHFDMVRPKADCLRILRDELARKIRPGMVNTGAMSDPYNPLEAELHLTRHSLELLCAYRFGVAIATKSDLILRDIDVLRELQREAPVLCKITITTADDALAAKIEPHAPPPSKRLRAIAKLANAGLPVCVLMMPVLPFLEDSVENVTAVVQRAAAAGASYLYPAFGVTLRQNQRDYFYQQLEQQFRGEYLATRYRKEFGERYFCASPHAGRLWETVRARCAEHGLLWDMKRIVSSYQKGYGDRQLTLF